MSSRSTSSAAIRSSHSSREIGSSDHDNPIASRSAGIFKARLKAVTVRGWTCVCSDGEDGKDGEDMIVSCERGVMV